MTSPAAVTRNGATLSALTDLTVLVTLRDGLGSSPLENVQVTSSPSARVIVTPKDPLLAVLPPFALVTSQERSVRLHPPGTVSVTV